MNTNTFTHQISEDGTSEWESPVLIPDNEIERVLLRRFILSEMPSQITAFGPYIKGQEESVKKSFNSRCSFEPEFDSEGYIKISYGPIALKARAFYSKYSCSKVIVEWSMEAINKVGLSANQQSNHAPYSPVILITDEALAKDSDNPLKGLLNSGE